MEGDSWRALKSHCNACHSPEITASENVTVMKLKHRLQMMKLFLTLAGAAGEGQGAAFWGRAFLVFFHNCLKVPSLCQGCCQDAEWGEE